MLTIAAIQRAEQIALNESPAGLDGNKPVTLRLYVEGAPASMLSSVVTVLTGRGAELNNVHIGEPSLEDVFINLTGRSLR